MGAEQKKRKENRKQEREVWSCEKKTEKEATNNNANPNNSKTCLECLPLRRHRQPLPLPLHPHWQYTPTISHINRVLACLTKKKLSANEHSSTKLPSNQVVQSATLTGDPPPGVSYSRKTETACQDGSLVQYINILDD